MNPIFEGHQLVPTRSAMVEMFRFRLDMNDVKDILELGYDCSRSRRSGGTIERCVDIKDKTLRAVVVQSFNHSLEEDVWVITHVGLTAGPGVRK